MHSPVPHIQELVEPVITQEHFSERIVEQIGAYSPLHCEADCRFSRAARRIGKQMVYVAVQRIMDVLKDLVEVVRLVPMFSELSPSSDCLRGYVNRACVRHRSQVAQRPQLNSLIGLVVEKTCLFLLFVVRCESFYR